MISAGSSNFSSPISVSPQRLFHSSDQIRSLVDEEGDPSAVGVGQDELRAGLPLNGGIFPDFRLCEVLLPVEEGFDSGIAKISRTFCAGDDPRPRHGIDLPGDIPVDASQSSREIREIGPGQIHVRFREVLLHRSGNAHVRHIEAGLEHP